MERVGNLPRLVLNPLQGKLLRDCLDRFRSSCYHDQFRRIHGSQSAVLLVRLEHLSDIHLVCMDSQHLPWVCELLHEFATSCDQFQTIFQAEYPGHAGGYILPNAMACDSAWQYSP